MQSIFNQNDWKIKYFNVLNMNPSENSSFIPEELSFPWSQIDIEDFQTQLQSHLSFYKEIATNILTSQIPELNNLNKACVCFTGSDGRAEKLSPFSSPLELIVVSKKKKSIYEETIKKITSVVALNPTIFLSSVEFRSISQDSLVCTESKEKEISFPTRALDATFLLGDAKIFTLYKTAYYQELTRKETTRKITAFKKSAFRPPMQLMERAIQHQEKTDLNLSEGLMTFDGDRVKATKYNLLRSVQYKMSIHICRLIKANKLNQESFIEMPQLITNRIQWLANKHLLKMTHEEVETVKKAYIASLIWYGTAQKNYELNQQKTLKVSKADLEKVSKAIYEFCTSTSIFKV